MLVCDTSGLLAYFDATERRHAAVSVAVAAEAGPFVVSPYVLAELDYLMATRHGPRAALSALDELCGGAWELPPFSVADVRGAQRFMARYEDQGVGLADASLVLLADRYRTNRILTLDHRHFRVLLSAQGRPFMLLPDLSTT
ncbi:MAG: PIN domain-containing protein [Solirubrobacteraceae bacterium]